MKKVIIATLCLLPGSLFVKCQTIANGLQRPKLVVGIVIDQMRWDYLYRFYDRYSEGGFKRLINQGFSCENTMINYLPSYTAVGHSTVFTGSVPSIDGITSNNWIDQMSGSGVYCTDDSTVHSVGTDGSSAGKMSPRNLLVTTITDELRIATHFHSRVVGVSLKDRAAILPAGHSANAAFWMDDASGNFISSTYYMKDLPDAVKEFNKERNIEKYIQSDWSTLYPLNTYEQSDLDDQQYEGKMPGDSVSVFPHKLKISYLKSKSSFRETPFGNSLTLDFAKRILESYQLGRGETTDFLTINCASTDYVGHLFGPNSIEVEDTYLRLDLDLASFFSLLDQKIGKNEYVVFLTADHGAANSVGFLQSHQLPADYFVSADLINGLEVLYAHTYGAWGLIRSGENYQINFDLNKVAALNINLDSLKALTVAYLLKQPGVQYAVDLQKVEQASIPEPIKTMIINGYNYKRSGQIQVIFQSGWLESSEKTGTTHGTWNPYDTHIPLLFMGWNIKHGSTNTVVHMTDISPTIAALLHIQMPSGNIGLPITEVLKNQ